MLQPLNPKNSSVLLVEDNPDDALIEAKALQQFGIKNIYVAGTGEEALTVLSEVPCDVVVVDYNLPGMNGLRLIERIREGWPDARVMMISGLRDPRIAASAVKAGAGDYVSKDESVTGAIMRALQDALRDRVSSQENGRRALLGAGADIALAREEIDWLREVWFEGASTPGYEISPDEEPGGAIDAFARYMIEAFGRYPEAAGGGADAVMRMFMERGSSPGEVLHCYRSALARIAREQPGVTFSPAICLVAILTLLLREYQIRRSLEVLEAGAGPDAG